MLDTTATTPVKRRAAFIPGLHCCDAAISKDQRLRRWGNALQVASMRPEFMRIMASIRPRGKTAATDGPDPNCLDERERSIGGLDVVGDEVPDLGPHSQRGAHLIAGVGAGFVFRH